MNNTQPSASRNRELMLVNVRQFWIEGVLNNSLHSSAMIQLGIASSEDKVDQPLKNVIKTYDGEESPDQKQADVLDSYDLYDGKFLILGAPGSGKTTMLLHLAEALLDRATANAKYPIPVIFNLSPWALQPKPIIDWLEDQLVEQYQAPKGIARQWLEQNELTLMLDGLDEISLTRRRECIIAINQFRAKYPKTDLIICSRIDDYTMLDRQLKLNGAVMIDPLSDEQIDMYLSNIAGMETARAIVREKPIMREMCRSPLFLVMLAVTYHDAENGEAVEIFDSADEQRDYILERYIQKMLTRKEAYHPIFTPEKARQYIGYLAHQMVTFSQTNFFLDTIQPTWLSERELKQYRFLSQAINIAIYLLAAGCVFLLSQSYAVVVLVAVPLVLFLGAAVGDEEGEGIDFAMRPALVRNYQMMISAGAVAVVIGGVHSYPLAGMALLAMEVMMVLRLKPDDNIRSFGSADSEVQQAIRNLGVVMLVDGLAGGLAWGFGWSLQAGLLMGLAWAIMGGMLYGGGKMLIRYYTMRLVLWQHGQLPLRLVGLMDYMVEHVLLRRVGSGYLFIHRYLLEYFAKRYQS